MSRATSSRSGREGGFVLPVALLVLVLLSLISAAGLHSARSQFRSAEAAHQAAVALAAADAGVALTLVRWAAAVPTLPPPGDSLTLPWESLPDGSLYRSVLVRAPVGVGDPASPMVLLRTTGRVAPPGTARRTVATWVTPGAGNAPTLCCDAAFKVQERIRVDGRDRNDPVPEIDGADRTPPGWPLTRCSAPTRDLPGVVSSDARGVDIRRDGDVAGAPPVLEDGTIGPTDFTDFGSMTYADLVLQADLDFSGNRRFRNAIRPVVSGGTCDTSVPTNWGSPDDPGGPCGAHVPVIHVAGNLTLDGTGTGQGILLVDGDLTLDDDFRFFGVAIVMGTVDLAGDSRFTGALVVRGDANGRGRSTVDDRAKLFYSSCAVRHAQAKFQSSAAAAGRFWFEVIG
ncbi:MAG: hypothetical protein AMXMBFR53_27590 [Gemmatimonadota bacterium]